ncbi:Elongation of very long chain fatty acids protein 1 [Halotydeus destructor]|nr:Elongation of very long chain fatty acids protein 1 [Halotydeus destructor]
MAEVNVSESALFPSWQHYATDFLASQGDPMTSEFFLMDGPLPLAAIGFALCYFCLHLGPKLMASRKPLDLKPWLLVYNGVTFGALICGVFLALYLVNGMVDTMSCDTYQRTTDDLKKIGLKYIAYVLLLSKMYNFLSPVAMVFEKRPVPVLHMLNMQLALMLIWLGVKLNPGGIFILFGLLDTAHMGLVGGYLVASCATDELKPSPFHRFAIFVFRMVTMLVTFIHGVHFLGETNCSTPIGLRFLVLSYSLLLLIFTPLDYFGGRRKIANSCMHDANMNVKPVKSQ